MAGKTIGAITTGVQTVTATGAVTPTAGLDVSGITGDWTLFIQVQSNTAAKKAKVVLEESVNAFTASTHDLVFDVSGAVGSTYDKVISRRKYELPSSIIGTTSAVIRANVQSITAGDSLAVRAWIEY
jgi:hypothetical protein